MCFLLVWGLCSSGLHQDTLPSCHHLLTIWHALPATAVVGGTLSLPCLCCWLHSLCLHHKSSQPIGIFSGVPADLFTTGQRCRDWDAAWSQPWHPYPFSRWFQAGWIQLQSSFEFFLQSGLLVPWSGDSLVPAMEREGHGGLRKYPDFRFRYPLLALA